jgi:hypothetical protein
MERLKAFFTNLGGPEPLSTKLRLFWRNQRYKFAHHTSCCGHPGEPGC